MEIAKNFLLLSGETLQIFAHLVEKQLQDIEKSHLLVATLFLTFVITLFGRFRDARKSITTVVKDKFFKVVRSIPYVQKKIDEEIEKIRVDLSHSIHASDNSGVFCSKLPEMGMKTEQVVEMADLYTKMESPKYLEGRVSGAVFSDESEEEMKVYTEVFKRFAWSNPLWPKLFPGVRKMEAEVIRMCCDLMNGGEEACGTMSTGGSMSIILACLAHRNRAYKRGVTRPEIILPSSAHAAFYKAAELFCMHVVQIPVEKKDHKVDPRKIKKSINKNTAMIVGSTPNFPYGSMDDIETISEIAYEYDVPLHVDACLGGFILPFLNASEYEIPKFDFRLRGVCSMSADTHKYGLTPKGSSVVLYKSKEYLHNQYFCHTDWQGGIYASPTLEGSRAGVNIALCWATMLYHGKSSYEQKARAVVDTTRKIRDGIKNIPEFKLQGASDICIVSFTSDKIDIHRFQDMMNRREWQLSALQFPSGVHLMVTLNHTKEGVVEEFLSDCREVVKNIVDNPSKKAEGAAALYGMAQKIPDRSIVREFANAYLDTCYSEPPFVKKTRLE
uniref:sphinganine-1-phosphate aldolase n=1 Tax=Acrobeloides nanus TaxID=290746 RepID=A0A914E360_9BILA